MTADDQTDALGGEDQLATSGWPPARPARRAQQRPGTQPEIEWLVPVLDGGQTVDRRPRWRSLADAAVVGAVVAAASLMIYAGGEGNEPQGPAEVTAVEEEAIEPQPAVPTALETVERRYRALNALDFDAIDADVAADIRYCRLAVEGSPSAVECLEASTPYFGPGGRSALLEIMALRAHAYGGRVEYRCRQQEAVVSCSQREIHLLLDAAGTEYEFDTLVYEVVDGQIVNIDDRPPPADGLVTSRVRTQEMAYGRWLEAERPEEFDALTAIGQPAATRTSAPRLRELVAEWLATTS